MKKQILTGLFIITIVLFASCTTSTPQETEKLSCSIKELVPAEIMIIEVPISDLYRVPRGSCNPTKIIADGIAKIGEKYIIKNAVPITEWVGDGSRTAALLVFVEPRKK